MLVVVSSRTTGVESGVWRDERPILSELMEKGRR